MASSAFWSTSRRGAFTGSSVSSGKDCRQEEPGSRQQGRRSKSVNPALRQMVESTAASSFLKRDNPLFNSPSLSPTDLSKCVEAARSDDRDSDCRIGRPISRGPGWSGGGGNSSGTRQGFGRSLSRVDAGRTRRSVSRGPRRKSEREREKEHVCSLASASRNKLTTGFDQSRPDDISGLCLRRLTKGSPSEAAWCRTSTVLGSDAEAVENEIRYNFHSETEEKPMKSVSEQQKRKNKAYMSDADSSDHPLELSSSDTVELTYEMRRVYALQLEQSEERVRKLQAELDTEEQRRLELSRVLFDFLPDPKAYNIPRIKHKVSIERKEMSKRLAEEAFSYFDECVSISTFDGSDFSSFDDPVSSTVHSQHDSHIVNGVSSASDVEIPITQNDIDKGLHDQSPLSPHIADSNLTPTNRINSISAPHQNLGCALSPRSGHCQFSLVGEEMQLLIKKFKRGKHERGEEAGRSGVNCDPFDGSNVQMLAEMVLYDRVTFRREINFGGLHLCDFKVI